MKLSLTKINNFQIDDNNDKVVESLEMAAIKYYGNFREKIRQLELELQREKKLRTNYHNKHCAAKKNWQARNLNLRQENARLQEEKKRTEAENARLLEEKKSAEGDMNLFERMLSEKDREIQKLKCDLSVLNRLSGEKDQKIFEIESKLEELEEKLSKNQNEYYELLDHFINVKVQMEHLLYNH